MNILKKNRLYATLLTIAITLVFTIPVEGSESDDEKDFQFYLLKDNTNTKFVKNKLKKAKLNSNTKMIKEIKFLSVEINTKNKNNIKLFEEEIENYIDYKALSSQVIANKKTDENLCTYKKTKSTFSDLSLRSNQFQPYNNYLTETTNEYKSYKYSKGKGVKIALVDTGVDINHPNLKSNIDFKNSKNYTSLDKKNICDTLGHGTGVAGILQTLAPEAKIVPYKVTDAFGGESLWTVEAIIDATNDKNDVINLSLGTYLSQSEKDQLLLKAYERAIHYAKTKNIIVVASSGNDGLDIDEYENYGFTHMPGGNTDVITISSTSNKNELAPYSNYGLEVDYSAVGGASFDRNYIDTPEDLIVTTAPLQKESSLSDQFKEIPSGYTLTEGTSFSTPQVSAAAALIISKNKKYKISRTFIDNQLIKGSVDLGLEGIDSYFGSGKVNIYDTLSQK